MCYTTELQRSSSSAMHSLQEECSGLKARVEELQQQNNTLVEQVTQISDNIAAIQSKVAQEQQVLTRGHFVIPVK